jgi:hypothetical protein
VRVNVGWRVQWLSLARQYLTSPRANPPGWTRIATPSQESILMDNLNPKVMKNQFQILGKW